MSSRKLSWDEYYGTKFECLTFLSDVLLHWPYLISILRIRPRVILEAGCGPGYHSLFLGLLLRDTKFILVDRDWSVLQLARKVAKPLGHRVHFCQADILRLPFKKTCFDVVISQGTLEHFNDSDLQQAISEQIRISPRVIFSVPSGRYWQQDFGDEILRSINEIDSLLRKIKGKFNWSIKYYRLDIGIRTKLLFYRHLHAAGYSWFRALWASVVVSFHILVCLKKP